MTNFEKLDWQQLLVLCDVLNSSSSFQKGSIKRRFNSESLHFNETFDFLIKLGLVSGDGKKILPSANFQKVIARTPEYVKDFFVEQLFKRRGPFLDRITGLLNNFELDEEVYKFTPNINQRLQYSGIRNFLISMGIISSIMPDGSYVVVDKFSTYLLDLKAVLSYTSFIEKLRANEEIGLRAELAVLDEERLRLKDNPELLGKIQHVSLQNVRAGYDIKSFEKSSTSESKWQSKYIEVKAVSEEDYRFYWSRNEISKARQLAKSYYLYLLPIKNEATLDISMLEEVRDPYKAIFQNKDVWMQENEVITFYKK